MFIQQTIPVLGYHFMMIFTFCLRCKWEGFTAKYVKEARFHISDIVFLNVFFQIRVCKQLNKQKEKICIKEIAFHDDMYKLHRFFEVLCV